MADGTMALTTRLRTIAAFGPSLAARGIGSSELHGPAPAWKAAERGDFDYHHHHQRMWPSLSPGAARQLGRTKFQAGLTECSHVCDCQSPLRVVLSPFQSPADHSIESYQVGRKSLLPAVRSWSIQSLLGPKRDRGHDAVLVPVRCNSIGTQSESVVEKDPQNSAQLEGAKRRVVFLGTPEVCKPFF